jgi:hypothetical protein
MKTREKIAFVLYMINNLVLIIFGFRYLFCDTIMPYHQQAIGMQWAEIEPGLQVLLNGLIKIAAAFFFIPGITIIVLLIIPFRKGERWAKWFIPGLSIFWLCFGLYVPINIAIKTNASTPWPASLVGLAITVAAFLFSGAFLKGQPDRTTATAGVHDR